MIIPFPKQPEPDDGEIIITVGGQRLRMWADIQVEELPPPPPAVDITAKKTSRSTKLRK